MLREKCVGASLIIHQDGSPIEDWDQPQKTLKTKKQKEVNRMSLCCPYVHV